MLLLLMDLMIFRQPNHRESYQIENKIVLVICIVHNLYVLCETLPGPPCVYV